MEKLYAQYGCSLTAPVEWANYDASPTLKIQKTPIIGKLFRSQLNIVFPANVKIGNIISGLPLKEDSCDGVFCSHVLEHLSLEDFRKALQNTHKILKPNGIFRCVVPDLEVAAKQYINSLESRDENASINFIKTTLLGVEKRPRGIVGLLKSYFGNTHHLWMWDSLSLMNELERAGFKEAIISKFNGCEDVMFKYVESKERFIDAVAVECRK